MQLTNAGAMKAADQTTQKQRAVAMPRAIIYALLRWEPEPSA
jgi:hypothetical protein